MKISIRMEGGIGDHLCAIRFLPAIKELYQDCEFYGFSDTEGNYAPKNIIETFWPSLFKNIEAIPTKKNETNIVNTRFGKEDYPAALDNIPEPHLHNMLNNYDKFYDMHIDGLKWLKYDFNWSKYFFQFLEPEINLGKINKQKNHLAVSLYSDNNSSNLLGQDYVYNLLSKLSSKYKITIFATEKNKNFYANCAKFSNIICTDLINVAREIRNSFAFLCIDSGLKFLGYSVGTPTFNFLSQIESYGNLPFHQYIRWNPFVWSVLPLYYDISHVEGLLHNASIYNTHLLASVPGVAIQNLLIDRFD